MKKRLISLILFLCMFAGLTCTGVHAYDLLYETNVQDTLGGRFSVVSAETDAREYFDYEVPEGGAAVLVFFNTECGLCQYAFGSLDDQAWISSEKVKLYALESVNHSTADIRAFATERAGSNAQYLNWYAAGDTDMCVSYQRAAGIFTGGWTWPAVMVCTETDGVKYIRYADTAVSDFYRLGASLEKLLGADLGIPKPVDVTVIGEKNYDYANEAVARINELRTLNGVGELHFDASLSELAMLRAAECSLLFSSARPDRSGYKDLIDSEFPGTSVAFEMEDSFVDSPTNLIMSLRADDSYYSALLDSAYAEIGLGCFRSGARYNWVVLLTDKGQKNDTADKSGSESASYTISSMPNLVDAAAPEQSELSLYPGGSVSLGIYCNPYRKVTQLIPPDFDGAILDSTTGEKIAEASLQADSKILITAIAPGSGVLSLPVYAAQKAPPSLSVTVTEDSSIKPWEIHSESEGGGRLELSSSNAKAGEMIYVSLFPDSGHLLKALCIEDPEGGYVTAWASSDTEYFFRMPESDVYIKAVFEAEKTADTEYSVILDYGEGGSVTSSAEKAKAGDSVIIRIAPAPGYKLASKAWTSSPEQYRWGDEYSVIFTMPSHDVGLKVLFEALPDTIGGSFGDGLSWKVEGNTLLISGDGSMGDNSSADDVPWAAYAPVITELIIEEGVTDIFAYAFENMDALRDVSIASTVTKAGYGCFADCDALEEISLSDSMTTPGNAMFEGCDALEQVTLPSSLKSVSAYCFQNCPSLRDIVFPDELAGISESAFENCTALASLSFPEYLGQIGGSAFAGCSAVESIHFASKPHSIGEDAFSGVSADVTVPAGDKSWSEDFTLDYGGSLSWNHSYSSTVIDPCCTEEGYTLFSCICGDSEKDNFTEPLGHIYEGWFVLNEKSEERSCTRCGSSESRAIDTVISRSSDFSPFKSNNIDEQNYDGNIWDFSSSPMRSYIHPLEKGGFMRVEYTYSDDRGLFVEYYNSDMEPIEQLRINEGEDRFGGFFAADNSYFVIYGYGNSDNIPGKEAVRIVRYDLNWNRLSSASYYGNKIKSVFASGSLRVSRLGDSVYIHTNSTTFGSDGSAPQSSFSLRLDLESMTLHSNRLYYSSNSFNQFIHSDGDSLITVDHGNALPRRGVILVRSDYNSEYGRWDNTDEVNTLPIMGEAGETYTGASIGGFEISSSGYLIAGLSIDQSKHEQEKTQNVYVSYTPGDAMDEESTVIRNFTDFDDSDSIDLSTPQLVKISDDRFLLMWNRHGKQEEYSMRYIFLNGKGEAISEEFVCDGLLSDCQPIVSGNSVVWYNTGSVTYEWEDGKIAYFNSEEGVPVFYSIDIQSGQFSLLRKAPAPCAHSWGEWMAVDSSTEERRCQLCGKTEQRSIATEIGFDDVRPTDWFAGCVSWAVENNITGGVGNNLFAPNAPCTRGQALSFIWRMLGRPAPESLELPFDDLVDGAYYHEAVCWGVENGIVVGMSETEFAPNAPCTRAQIVAMLWRVMGEPEPDLGSNPFADVKETSWFVRPVLWAVEDGITVGMSADRFEPNTTCTRAQIVTFLYRIKN